MRHFLLALTLAILAGTALEGSVGRLRKPHRFVAPAHAAGTGYRCALQRGLV
jgi:hypothetical protein